MCICMYIYMYICMYIYMYIHVYIKIYKHIYIYTQVQPEAALRAKYGVATICRLLKIICLFCKRAL